MEQYIPKSALLAEIERRRNQEVQWMEKQGYTEYHQGLRDGYANTLSFIDALEKEVDLDKEIENAVNEYYNECEKKLREMNDNDTDMSFLQLDKLAKHFFKLGL